MLCAYKVRWIEVMALLWAAGDKFRRLMVIDSQTEKLSGSFPKNRNLRAEIFRLSIKRTWDCINTSFILQLKS